MPHDEARTSHNMSKGPGAAWVSGARMRACSVVSWLWQYMFPMGDAPEIQDSHINLKKAMTKLNTGKVPFKDFSDKQQRGTEPWLMNRLWEGRRVKSACRYEGKVSYCPQTPLTPPTQSSLSSGRLHLPNTKSACVQILTGTLCSCATVGRLLDLSVCPQFQPQSFCCEIRQVCVQST